MYGFLSLPGTSDPYVKFKIGNKQLYKSKTVQKNLNPKWDEHFVLSIEDVLKPIQVKVYDYDRGSADDAMGCAEINLDDLQPNMYVYINFYCDFYVKSLNCSGPKFWMCTL